MTSLNDSFQGFAAGFSKMLVNSEPFLTMVENGLVSLSNDFERFSESNGFKDFISYLVTEGPQVAHFFSSTFGAVEQLVEGFAQVGAVILPVVNAFTTLANDAFQTVPGLKDVAAAAIAAYGAFKLFSDTAIGDAIGGLVGRLSAAAFGFDSLAASADRAAGAEGLAAVATGAENVAAGTGAAEGGVGLLAGGLGSLGAVGTYAVPIIGAMTGAILYLNATTKEYQTPLDQLTAKVTAMSASTLPQLTAKLDNLHSAYGLVTAAAAQDNAGLTQLNGSTNTASDSAWTYVNRLGGLATQLQNAHSNQQLLSTAIEPDGHRDQDLQHEPR